MQAQTHGIYKRDLMMLNNIQQQQWFVELRQNKRLQWMLLLVFSILLASLGKSFSDFVAEETIAVAPQRQLLTKLLEADVRPIEDLDVEGKSATAKQLLAQVPKASSKSVAEAQALTQIDVLINNYIDSGRATLVNTVDLSFGQQDFWQVRIEVRGKLAEKKLIGLLQQFDGTYVYQRIPSLQYRPKASNTVTLVVDYLFQKEER